MIVWFEDEREDLEEKQGSSKLARQAGIEYNDDDAYNDNGDDGNNNNPISTVTLKTLCPSERQNTKINYCGLIIVAWPYHCFPNRKRQGVLVLLLNEMHFC